jgi:transposase
MACAEKKARVEGRTIVFVDESGFYLLPGLVRTYAPCGQTPVLRAVYTRDHLAVMRGLTMDGRLYTLVRDEALDSLDRVIFLKHLLPPVSEKLLVIWDGSPIHKGHVRTFLADGGAQQIHVEQLPPYAPDLNPDEGVWHQLKNVEMRHLCCRHRTPLRRALGLAIRRVRRRPHVITACFGGAGLSLHNEVVHATLSKKERVLGGINAFVGMGFVSVVESVEEFPRHGFPVFAPPVDDVAEVLLNLDRVSGVFHFDDGHDCC